MKRSLHNSMDYGTRSRVWLVMPWLAVSVAIVRLGGWRGAEGTSTAIDSAGDITSLPRDAEL